VAVRERRTATPTHRSKQVLKRSLKEAQVDCELAYLDGEFLPLDQIEVGVRTHALHYGTGVFEGVRAYWNGDRERLFVFRPLDHYERLCRSAAMLGMHLEETAEDLCDATAELLERNGVQEDTYIRPLLFKSPETLGLWHSEMPESLVIFCSPFRVHTSARGARCCVSTWRRPDGNALPSRAKFSGAYVHSALARHQALLDGYDEAIMLSSRGYVSEATGENLFLVSRGKLVTPGEGEDLLAGITRDTLIELARNELGLEVVERTVNRSELYTADEVFLCGTALEITPVTAVDGQEVGHGQPGSVTRELQRVYGDVTRAMHPDYVHWCYAVDPVASQ